MGKERIGQGRQGGDQRLAVDEVDSILIAALWDTEAGEAWEDPVDAASAMLIMTMGAENGVEVTVESGNAGAVEEIAALVERDLDAEE